MSEDARTLTRIAFVGLGAMGSRIAGRLQAQGHELIVWNRTRARAAALISGGAVGATTPAEAARGADVVMTMVSDPDALRDVTEGGSGVLAGAQPGTLLIDMSTVGPAAVARLESLMPAGVALLDAPVLGSIAEAEAGTLKVFVGGDDAAVQRVMPLLAGIGEVLRTGPLGSGAAAKLVANAPLWACSRCSVRPSSWDERFVSPPPACSTCSR